MKSSVLFMAILLTAILVPGTIIAQDLMIYPKDGQSGEQMEKDKFECYSWAKKESGFDPMVTPTASTPPPQEQAPKGGLVKGAARGAVVGVAVGAIAGNAGKGAAIGAASGGLAGGMRKADQKREQEKAQEQWAQQQQNEYAQKRASYDRAYGACLEGKGYSVK